MEIVNQLMEISRQQELTTYSKKPELNLTPEENRVLELKYASKRFGQMKGDELHVCSQALLLKIHVITGWVIPVSNEFLDILIDQFEKKLAESYQNVNTDELEYAVRNYGTTVKDWGKQMNLSLIDEIMIPYLNQRAEVSAIEESKPPKMIENKETLSDQTMKDWFEDVKKNKLPVEFMPVMLYDWLDKKGEVKKTAAEKYEYLQRAVSYRHTKLVNKMQDHPSIDNKHELAEFNRMKEEGFEGMEPGILKNIAKRMILFDHLYT